MCAPGDDCDAVQLTYDAPTQVGQAFRDLRTTCNDDLEGDDGKHPEAT